MRAGRVVTDYNGRNINVKVVVIERGDVVTPEELISFARERELIYMDPRYRERVSIFYEETRNLREDYPVGALTTYFINDIGKRNTHRHK